MLLGVATNAQTRSVSGFPRVGGGGGGVGGDCGARSASLSASHPQSRRRRAGKSEVQPGLEANKARRRLGGAPVPLFLCCSSWLAGWLGEGGRQNPARIKAEARSADPDANYARCTR